jgi:hypothetical protein
MQKLPGEITLPSDLAHTFMVEAEKAAATVHNLSMNSIASLTSKEIIQRLPVNSFSDDRPKFGQEVKRANNV